jgi:hypothetical protein
VASAEFTIDSPVLVRNWLYSLVPQFNDKKPG